MPHENANVKKLKMKMLCVTHYSLCFTRLSLLSALSSEREFVITHVQHVVGVGVFLVCLLHQYTPGVQQRKAWSMQGTRRKLRGQRCNL